MNELPRTHHLSHFGFILTLLTFPYSETIKCVRFDSEDISSVVTTCEGDYCFKLFYTTANGNNAVIQDCVTGLVLTNGCTSDSVDRTMCICSTDNCNAGNESISGSKLRQLQCYDYVHDYEDLKFNITDADKLIVMGTFCNANGKFENYSDYLQYYFQYSTWKDDVRRAQYAFPIGTTTPYDLQFNVYYHGEMYRVQYRDRLEFYQYCVEDLCNRMDFFSFTPGSISCNLNTTMYGEEDDTCMGQFCVFSYADFERMNQNDWSEHHESWQYCLSTNSSFSKHSMEVGTYAAYKVTHFVCNTNGCNGNRKTAEAAIEAYRKQHPQLTPTTENISVRNVNTTLQPSEKSAHTLRAAFATIFQIALLYRMK